VGGTGAASDPNARLEYYAPSSGAQSEIQTATLEESAQRWPEPAPALVEPAARASKLRSADQVDPFRREVLERLEALEANRKE
jgi:hypothetical protein